MSLCMGCMHEIENKTLCPDCGFDNTQSQSAPFLPYKTELQQRYLVGNRIETNGESTRYIGFDKHTGDIIVIREYLPVGLFERQTGETQVQVGLSTGDNFNKIKNEFISYFRIVQKLKDFSAMMTVYDLFEENGTAYVIEQNEDLIPFEEYIERSSGQLEWDVARPLFMPLISALEALHKNGVGHYAVAPSNIYITSLGKMKLFGFSTIYERKRGTALKSQLFSGCAAPEQYESNFPLDAITDIYGFAATLFYALTGNLPRNATERVKDSRLLMSTNTVKRLPPHVVTALANGLNVKRENRITDFDDLRSQLSAAPTVQAIQEEISRTASMNPVENKKEKDKSQVSTKTVFIISLIVSLIVLSVAGYFWYLQNPFEGFFNSDNHAEETTSPEDEKWTGPVVEDYVGKVYSEVVAQAEEKKEVLIYKSYEEQYSDTIEEGRIISQYPSANTPIKSEGEIAVYVVVSKGPLMRELPEIENLTVSDAAKVLSELGFLVERVNEYNANYGEDRVVGYKDNQIGDKLERGSMIKIRVSLGKEPTT